MTAPILHQVNRERIVEDQQAEFAIKGGKVSAKSTTYRVGDTCQVSHLVYSRARQPQTIRGVVGPYTIWRIRRLVNQTMSADPKMCFSGYRRHCHPRHAAETMELVEKGGRAHDSTAGAVSMADRKRERIRGVERSSVLRPLVQTLGRCQLRCFPDALYGERASPWATRKALLAGRFSLRRGSVARWRTRGKGSLFCELNRLSCGAAHAGPNSCVGVDASPDYRYVGTQKETSK